MSGNKSRYEEIVLRIMPAAGRLSGEQQTEALAKPSGAAESTNIISRLVKWMLDFLDRKDLVIAQSYDAWIYTNLEIPGLEASPAPASESAKEVSGLKLAGRGQVKVHWEHYKEYLRTFTRGEKAAYKRFWGAKDSQKQHASDAAAVRTLLFEMSSPALQALFVGELNITERPLRVWLHCNPPELADLPWELLTCALRKKAKTNFSFVRGLPPAQPLPRVPVEGRLRLAFIHDPRSTPNAIINAMQGLKSTLDVVEMTEHPREALKRAAKEGFELVHLVADAAVSLGNEGLLYLRQPPSESSERIPLHPFARRAYRLALNNPRFFKVLFSEKRLLEWNERLIDRLDIETCSAEELCAILRGSRVTLFSLSTPKTDDNDIGRFDGALLPAVYSAFASLGSFTMLPNIIAPLGACDESALEKFWSTLYSQLMNSSPSSPQQSRPSFSLEEAMAVALEESPTVLMALFLRQRLGREFTNRVVRIGEDGEDPNRANAKLQVERRLLEQLRAIDSNYRDIESRVSDTPLIQAEIERQSKLGQEIDSLAQLEEGEL